MAFGIGRVCLPCPERFRALSRLSWAELAIRLWPEAFVPFHARRTRSAIPFFVGGETFSRRFASRQAAIAVLS
jgi:hypothetical protein